MANESLYKRLTNAGIKTENHYSDLYFPVTEESKKILDEYRKDNNLNGMGMVTTFTNQVEGGRWYDVPFAYDPYWENLT